MEQRRWQRDGITRRGFLRVGSLSPLGIGLAPFLQAFFSFQTPVWERTSAKLRFAPSSPPGIVAMLGNGKLSS